MKLEKLENLLNRKTYLVWDAKTGKRISHTISLDPKLPFDIVPAPDIIVDATKEKNAGFIICPDPPSAFAVLLALELVPKNVEYVVGIHEYNLQSIPEGLFLEIPEDMLLVGYDGISNLGMFADVIDFSFDPDKRAVTLREVSKEQHELLGILGNERCLESIVSTPWTAKAFGFASISKLSKSQKQDVSKVLGCKRDLKFFDDDFPQEKRDAIIFIDNVSNPLFADDVNNMDKAKQAIYESRSCVPELTKYRPLWLAIMKEEEARLKSEGVEFEGVLPAEDLSNKLEELGRAYGIDSMMKAVDAGVPAEDVVLDSSGFKPNRVKPQQQKAFDSIVKHLGIV